ncbi:uncharacterized protein A4U43_C07F36010 [Asparagus officinalis]|uniref:Oberon coiled-coil region domain-containing protein n=1 Tax=Asparagus officinalis TaxID=4686 RepID=A0A5P1EMQ9_ASPOF|nr:uncharacterized protein A4U43_C07F36010 [Asparagus officinalis]
MFARIRVMLFEGMRKISLGLGLARNRDGAGFQGLETLLRFKEEESKLIQRLADDALVTEVEGYRWIAKAKAEKPEEEYAAKLAKLCIQEAGGKRRKKF